MAWLWELSRLSLETGELDRALELAEEARDTVRDVLGVRHPHYPKALRALAEVCTERCHYDRARRLYEQAIGLVEKYHKDNTGDLASIRFSLGQLEMILGRFDRARDLFEETTRWVRMHRGEKHPNYMNSLAHLASVHRALGEVGRARDLLEDILERQRAAHGIRNSVFINTLGALGRVHESLGNRERASELYEQTRKLVREVFGAQHALYGVILGDLARLHRTAGFGARALALAEESLGLIRARVGSKHSLYASALGDVATACREVGQYDRAIRTFEEEIRLQRLARGEKHPSYIIALHNLAMTSIDVGDLKKAIEVLEEAVRRSKASLGDRHELTARCLGKWVLAEYLRGKTARAEELARQSMSIGRRHAEDTLTALGEYQQIEFLHQYREQVGLYLLISRAAHTPGRVVYEQVLRWKGVVGRKLAEQRLVRDEPALAAPLTRLALTRAALAALVARRPTPEGQKQWQKRFAELSADKERIERDLAKQSEAFRRQQQIHPKELARALPAGTALVDVIEYDARQPAGKDGPSRPVRRLAAFVVVGGREVVRVELGPAEPVNNAILRWRKPLYDASGGIVDTGAAALLRKLVWQPLAAHLGGCKVILVAADGMLSGLPLAALPGSKPGTFLIEEVAIAAIPGAASLFMLGDEKESDGLLMLGGLYYGKTATASSPRRRPSWSALPGTRLEANHVLQLYREHFRRGRVPLLLEGKDGDRTRLIRELTPGGDRQRWRYLHLATHGYFSAEQAGTAFRRHPLLAAGLVLAGVNDEPEKGLLTAEEVAALDLRGCALVVLSACETGVGRVAIGEGVLGLQRAFHLAGARATVTSLWSISDPATSELIEQFDGRLWGEKKVSKLEALRQAQLHVLRNPQAVLTRAEELRKQAGTAVALRAVGKKAVLLPSGRGLDARSPPAWWAAFVLSGDWR
jgi:CHAT domain-containing protein